MTDKLGDIQQQKEELERLLAARERYIQELRNSFSWRITAPLRWLNTHLFRLAIGRGRTPLRPAAVSETIDPYLPELLTSCRSATPGRVVAILDHDLGGGANYYSQVLARRLVSASYRVLHLKMNPDTGLIRICSKMPEADRETVIPAIGAPQLMRLLALCSVEMVIVNELVGWPAPPELFRALAIGEIPYTVLVHDYFPVCPNWNLIGAEGRPCGLCVDRGQSRRCLKGNTASGAYALYGDTYTDMDEWRESATVYLSKALGVVCFSEASRRIVTAAFAGLANTSVIEHAVSLPGETGRIRTITDGLLRVGVLGCSGMAKGAGIVAQLAANPALAGLPVELTVLGEALDMSLPKQHNREQIRLHGRYRREELATLVERYGIQVMLVPSIWPETFSYTVSEALLLGCPVICFDLGAQAERVRRHDGGVVVQEVSAAALVKAFASLLTNPGRVEEMSRNALRYRPPTEEEHFAEIFRITGMSAQGLEKRP